MRSVSPALAAFLKGGGRGGTYNGGTINTLNLSGLVANLFTLSTNSQGFGALKTFYFTDANYDISYNNGITTNVYKSSGILMSLQSIDYKNTMEVTQAMVHGAIDPNTTYNDYPLMNAIYNGLFDGGRMIINRVFMPTPGDTSLGAITLWDGRIEQVDQTATGCDFTTQGDNVLMNQNIPKNVFQYTCIHRFCDTGCTLNQANFSLDDQVIGSAPTKTFVQWTNAPTNYADYILGIFSITSGVNTGFTTSINNIVSSGGNVYIYPVSPIFFQPNQGDTFNILQGCNKTVARCQTLTDVNGNSVDNLSNIRIFPFIPQPEQGV